MLLQSYEKMVSLSLMNRIILILVALATLCSCTPKSEPRATTRLPKIEILLKTTPVKDQGQSQLCWIFAMLATIETEHLMRGDSVNLSTAYVARMALRQRIQDAYLAKGKRPIHLRGMASNTLSAIADQGLLAYDTYHVEDYSVFSAFPKKAANLCRLAVAQQEGLVRLGQRYDNLADQSIGALPRAQFMLGAEYTLGEFGRSVCRHDEYVGLTSFTHHPFNTTFALEVPDNVNRDCLLNLPIDSLVSLTERSLHAGHPLCWEGDTSEPGFNFAQAIARIPEHSTAPTQQMRQREFETFRTTDDHCMAIVGLARDAQGKRYFIMKNSWGTDNAFKGFMFMSEDYFRMKTIALWAQRECLGT